jgi:hypothetical protein
MLAAYLLALSGFAFVFAALRVRAPGLRAVSRTDRDFVIANGRAWR